MLKPRPDLPFQPITWGGEPHDFTVAAGGNHMRNLGIYTTETAIQRYVFGTRHLTWDGRVYKYASTGAANYALNVDFACRYANSVAQAYDEVGATASAIGDTTIGISAGTHTAFTKDQLAGGFLIVYYTGGGGHTQFRGIIGNDASAENAAFTLYLDSPLTVVTVASTTSCEVWYNPYSYLSSSSNHAFAGKPAVQIAAANTYFWVQTWGLCWLAHNSSDSALTNTNLRGTFRHDGSYEADYAMTNVGGVHTSQIAGIPIVRDAGPLFMLQISI